MAVEELVLVISRLSVGAIATFLAILLWSNTRDICWMLIIMGTILQYGEIMYSTLVIFGVVPVGIFIIPGLVNIQVILQNLPALFYCIAFVSMLMRIRRSGG